MNMLVHVPASVNKREHAMNMLMYQNFKTDNLLTLANKKTF